MVRKTSNLDSNSSRSTNIPHRQRRRRKRPVRYDQSSDDSLFESGSESLVDWKTEKIKIYSYSKDKVDMVGETSNLDSNSSRRANIPHRQRRRGKRPARYDQSSDDSFSESESESLRKKPKQNKTLSLPTGLSESSDGEEPNATSESRTAVFNQLIKYMKVMHGELQELNAKSESMNSKMDKLISIRREKNMIPLVWVLPSGVNLPVETDEALLQLNENLKNDKELSATLVGYLYNSVHGRTALSFVSNITRKVLSPEVALMYSRYGRKGKKSFSNLLETLNVILAVAALKFKDTSREDLLDKFGKALSGASEWNGKKTQPLDPLDYVPDSPICN